VESPKFISWEAAVSWLREQPDRCDLIRDAYYDDPLVAAAERYSLSDEWVEIGRTLAARTGRALDLGAGRGIASYALARRGFQVIALEPDPSALVGAGAIRSLAEATGLPIEVRQERSEVLPFPDETFDVVFARALLHHTTDLSATCREVHRVLKRGGLFLAVREHVISKHADLKKFQDSHPLHNLYGGEHAFLLKEYLDALKQSGFSAVEKWGPLESAINYYPHSTASLRREVVRRAWNLPGLNFVLSFGPAFRLCLRLLSIVDSRPGRLYSFLCEKSSSAPAKANGAA
jgi:SAM-dependent methyltransferase